MKQSNRLRRVVDSFRDQIDQHVASGERALQDAHANTLKAIEPHLHRLYRQIAEAQGTGEDIAILHPSWLYESQRLETIQKLISHQIDHYATLAKMQVTNMQHQALQLGSESSGAQLQATVPNGVSWSFGVPNPKAINKLIGATRNGSPLADLFNGFGAEASQEATSTLIMGVTTGMNPNVIGNLLQQILDVPLWRAQTIARTETLRAYRSANLETFRANSDVVSQWRWTAHLSARTCAACIEMDGSLHDLDESLDSHVNCRCTATPVTKSWKDILGSAGVDTSGMDLEETSYSNQSGSDWFDQQDSETQQSILGKGKYELYRDGMSLSDMVGTKHDPDWGSSIYVKSLKELTR